jgi:hypothetical protein
MMLSSFTDVVYQQRSRSDVRGYSHRPSSSVDWRYTATAKFIAKLQLHTYIIA